MAQYYKHYRWIDGIPHGYGSKQEKPFENIASFRIVSDPYKKRIVIEHYVNGKFSNQIYDSALLDFRDIKNGSRQHWHQEVIQESQQEIHCLIRNQEDRILCKEIHSFEGHLCRKCLIHSPTGILLATQNMSYCFLQDGWNGVELFDSQAVPVMSKRYDHDPLTGEFTHLLSEHWKSD